MLRARHVLSALLVLAGCASEVPEEETAWTEGALLAGREVPQSEIASHLRSAGFAENMIGKMVCVAKWESTFFERAKNGSHYGLYQISKLHLGAQGCPSSAEALYGAKANIQCAASVYKRQGIKAWVAYGAHKKECDSYAAPGGGAAPAAEPDDDDDDDVATTPAPNGEQCWSPTAGKNIAEGGCVQNSANIWFQCQDGKWYRGGNATKGPYGACVSSRPFN